MVKPYKQLKIGSHIIRYFSSKAKETDLQWHTDQYDRYVKVLFGKEWRIQFDEEIPLNLNAGSITKIHAKKMHRLKKGKGPLLIYIKECL